MAEQGLRVALLAREGQARERLQKALQESGAELVAVADPYSADPAEVASAQPQGLLVALEPAIEDALEGWGALLSDPSLVVIYDEAELAAARAGWDAARWIRHLRAKLQRHDDVLPPGAEPAQESQPEPGALQQPDVAGLDEEFRAIEGEAQDSADEVPADEGLEAWLERMSAAATQAAPEQGTEERPETAVAHPSGQGTETSDTSPAALDDAPATSGIFANLELADPATPVADSAVDGNGVDSRIAALEERIAGLSLADADHFSQQAGRGAVLVEAGLGGPDAVRQLLAALGERFPRPLLVRLRLEGGRYERLVRQMDRATTLSVVLADEGVAIETGRVYFLPDGVDVVADGERLKFADSDTALQRLPAGLAAEDSAILFMSGADAGLVEQAMGLAGAGALVLGQSMDTSFDATAAQRLMEQGGEALDAAAIAARLQARWPSQDDPAGTGEELQS